LFGVPVHEVAAPPPPPLDVDVDVDVDVELDLDALDVPESPGAYARSSGSHAPSGPSASGLEMDSQTDLEMVEIGSEESIELDLPIPASSLPLRQFGMPMPTPGISPGTLPPPLHPSSLAPRPSRPELSFPPIAARAPDGLIDLPMPAVGTAPGSGMELPPPPPTGFTDLLRPTGQERGAGMPLPPPPGGLGVDLPIPSRASDHGFAMAHSTQINLPSTPAGAGRNKPAIENRARPQYDEHNLLQPTGMDLPQPRGMDLPQPIGMDLPQPVANELEPSQVEVAPLVLDLQAKPDNMVSPLDLSVAPRDMGMLEPRGQRSGGAGAHAHASGSSAAFAREAAPYRAGYSPRSIPDRSSGIPRWLLFGGLGVAVVAGAGMAAFLGGFFDGEETTTTRSGAVKPPENVTGGRPVERSEAVLQLLRADTPKAYREALELAGPTASGDPVGAAEAALLLHLRYGPDNVLSGQAAALLKPYAQNTEPFVRRVLALQSMSRSALPAAEQALTGDDERTRLYRGMLALEQDKASDALTEADAVLAIHGDDVAATHLRYSARLELEPKFELEELRNVVAAHPGHPGLVELLVKAATSTGYLAFATQGLDQLRSVEGASDAYRARLLALQGQVATARGDHFEAVRQFDAALALSEGSYNVILARARVLAESGNLVEAKIGVNRALEVVPDSLEAQILKVEILIRSGDGDAALEQIRLMEQAQPESAELAFLTGRVHAMRLQIDDATKAFALALQRDPGLGQVYIAEADMLTNAHKPDAALQKLDSGIEGYREKPDALVPLLLKKANILERDKLQPQDAIAALDRVLELQPTDNEAQTSRGVLRLGLGDEVGGRSDLMQVFERTGGYPGMSAPLGRLLARDGEIERLASLVGDRAELPESETEIKLVAARLRLLEGNAEGAKAMAEAALAREPNNWEAHMLLADAHRLAGEYPEALLRIKAAKPATPQAELHLLRGKILEFNGRYAEARPEYQRALVVDPNLHEARFLYGRSLAYAGAGNAAIEELTRVIQATGNLYPAAYGALGRAYKELGNYTQALESLDKAIELDPGMFEAWYHKGTVHAFKSQHRPSAEALAHAVDEQASAYEWYVDAWMRLGRERYLIGERSGAKNALSKYLELAPRGHASREEAERLLRDL